MWLLRLLFSIAKNVHCAVLEVSILTPGCFYLAVFPLICQVVTKVKQNTKSEWFDMTHFSVRHWQPNELFLVQPKESSTSGYKQSLVTHGRTLFFKNYFPARSSFHSSFSLILEDLVQPQVRLSGRQDEISDYDRSQKGLFVQSKMIKDEFNVSRFGCRTPSSAMRRAATSTTSSSTMFTSGANSSLEEYFKF